MFSTEMSMMLETLKDMNDLLGKENRVSGKGLFCQKESPTFLIMEDLAPLGYCMADRNSGLDLAHCLLAIQGLARFHASSVATCEKVCLCHFRLFHHSLTSLLNIFITCPI